MSLQELKKALKTWYNCVFVIGMLHISSEIPPAFHFCTKYDKTKWGILNKIWYNARYFVRTLLYLFYVCFNHRELDFEDDPAEYLSGEKIWTWWLWINRKRNVSVCIGHYFGHWLYSSGTSIHPTKRISLKQPQNKQAGSQLKSWAITINEAIEPLSGTPVISWALLKMEFYKGGCLNPTLWLE